MRLDVSLPSVSDDDEAQRLVAAAHKVCPYSNATRGNIDVTITVNGNDVASTSEEEDPNEDDD